MMRGIYQELANQVYAFIVGDVRRGLLSQRFPVEVLQLLAKLRDKGQLAHMA